MKVTAGTLLKPMTYANTIGEDTDSHDLRSFHSADPVDQKW